MKLVFKDGFEVEVKGVNFTYKPDEQLANSKFYNVSLDVPENVSEVTDAIIEHSTEENMSEIKAITAKGEYKLKFTKLESINGTINDGENNYVTLNYV